MNQDQPSGASSTTTVSVAVAGSTGSIGVQTLDVIAREPDRYRVAALATGSNIAELAAQTAAVRPGLIAIGDSSKAGALAELVDASVTVLAGPEGMAEVAKVADVTVNGIVGFAGLPVTMACLLAGKRLALANKESLIAAGPVVQQARKTPGAEIVPVDSEHAAIHQCLRSNNNPSRVDSIQLIASGGPFRGRSVEELETVTVDEALKHPTWSMGPKITIDSSTLMNKGLEVIEAFELFGTPGADGGVELDQIQVVVHPQSIVHSMVTFTDGSTIAQLSEPDMRLPIVYALAYPDRSGLSYSPVDWSAVGRLDFEPPDRQAFPCLDLAFDAGRLGGTAPAWLSAANEVAVDSFLQSQIKWADIAKVISSTMESYDGTPAESLDAVLEADQAARATASSILRLAS